MSAVPETVAAQAGNGLGSLSILPLEVRQEIFGMALKVERDVKIKMPTVAYGRFNLLLVSKTIHHEAIWVLHHYGRLFLEMESVSPDYLKGYILGSLDQLGDIPRDAYIRNFWLAASKYRNVRIDLTDVCDFTDLLKVVALLFKSWKEGAEQPTANPPHKVQITLGEAFEFAPLLSDIPSAIMTFSHFKILPIFIGKHLGTAECVIKADRFTEPSSGFEIRTLDTFKRRCADAGIRFEE